MCTYHAFYYTKCKNENHIKFVRKSQCWTNMLNLETVNPAMMCTERIINGDPEAKVSRKFPTTDDICPICSPKEAAAQAEERKKDKKGKKA